jgi:hypothetical protein
MRAAVMALKARRESEIHAAEREGSDGRTRNHAVSKASPVTESLETRETRCVMMQIPARRGQGGQHNE